MGGLAITLPGEAVLFSIKTVITRRGVTRPPSEGILAERAQTKTSRFSASSLRLPSPTDFLLGTVKEKRQSLSVNPRLEGDVNGVPPGGGSHSF